MLILMNCQIDFISKMYLKYFNATFILNFQIFLGMKSLTMSQAVKKLNKWRKSSNKENSKRKR